LKNKQFYIKIYINAMSELPKLTERPPEQPEFLPQGQVVVGQGIERFADEERRCADNGVALRSYVDQISGDNIHDEQQWRTVTRTVIMMSGGQLPTDKEVSDGSGSYGALARDLLPHFQQQRVELDDRRRQAAARKLESIHSSRQLFAELLQQYPQTQGQIERGINMAHDMPPVVRAARNHASHASWLEWLATKADDPQLDAFLQWHTGRIRRFNTDPAICDVVEGRRRAFMRGVETVFDEGYLHPTAYTQTMDTMAKIPIHGVDMFGLALRNVWAYVDGESRFVACMPDLLTNAKSRILEHELGHLGVTSDQNWINEVATDILTGMVRSDSTQPADILRIIQKDEPPYGPTARRLMKSVGSAAGLRMFMRYASAPEQEKPDALQELNFAVGYSDEDFIGYVGPTMHQHFENALREESTSVFSPIQK
jgi:hypothetical protein